MDFHKLTRTIQNESKNYFGSLDQDFKSFDDFLKEYSKYYRIYINSRSVSKMIVEYLKAKKLFQYISGVYGAIDILSVGLCEDFEELWTYLKAMINNKILNKIRNKEQIIFFDDTKENIVRSREKGFSNSFQVPGDWQLWEKVDYFKLIIEYVNPSVSILPPPNPGSKRSRNQGNNSSIVNTNRRKSKEPKKMKKNQMENKINQMEEINEKINNITTQRSNDGPGRWTVPKDKSYLEDRKIRRIPVYLGGKPQNTSKSSKSQYP